MRLKPYLFDRLTKYYKEGRLVIKPADKAKKPLDAKLHEYGFIQLEQSSHYARITPTGKEYIESIRSGKDKVRFI